MTLSKGRKNIATLLECKKTHFVEGSIQGLKDADLEDGVLGALLQTGLDPDQQGCLFADQCNAYSIIRGARRRGEVVPPPHLQGHDDRQMEIKTTST